MDFQKYLSITGLSVPSSQEGLIYAQISHTQLLLEEMLGYTLDADLVDLNEYEETGKLDDACPCTCGDVDEESLEPADDVVFAYRMFNYRGCDKFLAIDPATAVHAVKLVKNGVTYKTLEASEYRPHFKRGITKYLEQCACWCSCRVACDCVQLAVDADWVWPENEDLIQTIPADLLMVWADMTTYYADLRRGLKKETLGSHSYEKFDNTKPETITQNMAIIQRYAGPNGTAFRSVT